jgi:hypothetical protein
MRFEKGTAMAFRSFWNSVRTVARMLAPQVVADSPRIDGQSIERALQRATLWLTPRAVDGFDEADFDFLAPEERARLAQLVSDFRAVASTVSPRAAASEETMKQALPLFRDIILALEWDRYGDAEVYRLGKQIEHELKSDWPEELAELRFWTGPDHTGDPGIWILGLVKDDAASTDEQFLNCTRSLRPLIESTARTVASDRWPYVSFRSVGEQVELVGQP